MIIVFIMGSLAIFILPLNLLSALGEPVIKTLPTFTGLGLVFLALIYMISRKFYEKSLVGEENGLVQKFIRILNLIIKLPYPTLLILIVFSALFQSADIVASFTIAKALNINVPLTLFFSIIPIVYICTILPLSRRFGSARRDNSLLIG